MARSAEHPQKNSPIHRNQKRSKTLRKQGFSDAAPQFASHIVRGDKTMPDGSTFSREQLASVATQRAPTPKVSAQRRELAARELWESYQEAMTEFLRVGAIADNELGRVYESLPPRPACLMGRRNGELFPLDLEQIRQVSPLATKEEKALAKRRVAEFRG